jgi:hypothetical protein
MFTYAPPANIDDLAGRATRDAFLQDWHTSMASWFEREIHNLPSPTKLFFSEMHSAATSAEAPIAWNAFPLSIARMKPDDPIARWSAADQLQTVNRSPDQSKNVPMPCRLQDEYCEWFAYRDVPGGPITRIVFTAEAPEYWIALAAHDFDRVVELYQTYVSPSVKADDLRLQQDIAFSEDMILKKGSYNPYNDWNTSKGVMHLTHPANTLGAEVNLAARATIPRRDSTGVRITEVRRFACASNFGDPNRSSDPNIGIAVNLTAFPAAAGSPTQSVTLANPVALYMDQLAAGTVTDEAGTPLQGWFKIVRGVAGRGLMAVLQPPPGSPFGLDKIRIRGRALTHGGQVAERIQMILYGKTANLGQPVPALQHCIRHCCCDSTAADLAKVNFGHETVADLCGSGSKDAYPELIGTDPAPSLTAAANETGASVRPLSLSRLAGTQNG